MKKTCNIPALLAVLLAFAACNNPVSDSTPTTSGIPTTTGTTNTVPVDGVSLNKETANIFVGDIETLSVTITPSNATNKNVTWTSSNTTIATISTDGVVTAVSAGITYINAATKDGGFQALCTVTVSPRVSVTGVSLKASTELLVNHTETLYAIVEPDNATNKNITWSSNETSIATVSTEGVVTAVSEGTATVTVTTVDGNKTASCTVTVSIHAIAVTGVSLNKTSASLVVGGTEELTATITPSTATNQNITWKSGNTNVAEVSAAGVVTAKNVGSTNITVTTADGNKTATCGVTVNPKVITFTVDAISAQTYTGSAIKPTVTVRDGLTTLTLTTHYTVAYTNNTNAGTATVTVSGAGNYKGSSGSRTFTINKAAGATVSTPTGTSSVTSSSITINAVAAPSNGQTVEYARNTINTPPSSGWQDSTTFSGLTSPTVYIFARSKENVNYNAGTPSASFRVSLGTVEMVYVPGGSFQMGKELGTSGTGDYTPVHTVTLTSFYIGKYEVTQAQYQAVMGTNPSSFSSNPAAGDVQGNRPVDKVNWYDAIEFCNALSIKEGLSPYYSIDKKNKDPNNTNSDDTMKWTVTCNNTANGYRLPTEAQWEYAAKGGTKENYTYSGSNTIGDVAWYYTNSDSKSHEVGKKQPNGLGIYDMSGNVVEWCWDWDWSYSSTAQTDPQGAATGDIRVSRGGSWNGSTFNTCLVYRGGSGAGPDRRYSNAGFRLVRP